MPRRFYKMEDWLGGDARRTLTFPLTNSSQLLAHSLGKGVAIAQNEICNITIFREGAPRDVSFFDVSIPLLNQKAAAVFRTVSESDVQLVPAKIEADPGEYYVLNALKTLDCADPQLSTYYAPPQPDRRPRFLLAVIDLSKVKDEEVFRLSANYLVVDETVRAKVRAAGLTGVQFQKLRTVPGER